MSASAHIARAKRHGVPFERFGRLTAEGAGRGFADCTCDCGQKRRVPYSSLRSGRTQSCGCLKAERSRERRLTHGLSKTRTYQIWRGMVDRCTRTKHKNYAEYGGRGIQVCDRWRDFAAFYADMGECPPGCSIERLDVNRDYAPDNCKWLPARDQNNNKRNSVLLTHDGKTLNIAQWAALTGISATTLYGRVGRPGWTDARIVTTTPRMGGRRSRFVESQA